MNTDLIICERGHFFYVAYERDGNYYGNSTGFSIHKLRGSFLCSDEEYMFTSVNVCLTKFQVILRTN